ncbi:MAG: hypothetical protein OHK0038_00400 [Flammeovirgaceae bacterium]
MNYEIEKNYQMKKNYQYLLYFVMFWLISLIFNRCANSQPPQGGAKDTIPPVLIGSIPQDSSINYKGNTLTLLFNEDVVVENINKELVITPNKSIKFRHTLKRNKLTIKFDEPFEDSTTYSVDFRESVKDFSEKNPAKNLRLAFSTWNTLDTLYIKGEVRDLMSGLPIKDAIVALYADNDTLTITKNPPLYFTKTNDKGQYQLGNLSAKSYKLYTLLDKDNNLKYSKDDEAIGFLSTPIIPSQQDSLVLFSTVYDNKPLVFNKAQTQKGYTDLIFNKPLKNAKITPTNEDYIDKIYFKIEKNSIYLYYADKNLPQDSTQIAYFAEDSLGQSLKDTLNVKFAPKDESKPSSDKENAKQKDKENKENTQREAPQSPKLKFTQVSPKGLEISKNEAFNLVLSFPVPLKTYFIDSLKLSFSKEEAVAISQKHFLSEDRTVFTIENFNFDRDVSLDFKKGAFVSIFDDSTDVNSLKFTLKKPEKYGIINGKVETTQTSFIIQLLNDKFEVEKEIRNQTKFRFENVNPGKKFIRVLIDENLDNQWSKGSFKNNIVPEKVYHFIKEIELKANWEIVEEDVVLKF